MVSFNDFILTLERMGVSDVLLPFVLVFTIVFAVSSKLSIFENNKKFQVVLGMVLAFGVVIPHVTNSYPSQYDIVNIINQSLPNVSIIVIGIVCALILLGVFGIKFEPGQKSIVATGLWILSIGLIVFVFGSSAGWGWKIPNWLGFLNDSDTQAFLIIIVVFWAIISFVTGNELSEEEKKAKREGRMDNLKNFFQKIQE